MISVQLINARASWKAGIRGALIGIGLTPVTLIADKTTAEKTINLVGAGSIIQARR